MTHLNINALAVHQLFARNLIAPHGCEVEGCAAVDVRYVDVGATCHQVDDDTVVNSRLVLYHR